MRESPTIEANGLVLGATRLAKRDVTGSLEIRGDETRVLALLSVAYGRVVDARAIAAFRRAETHVQRGNDALAAMHIALAGLPTLPDPADAARRLCIADGLLANGVSPQDMLEALGFDPSFLDELKKYGPEEPRVPAGSGRPSGEWTRELETVESAAEEILSELPRVASGAARVAAGAVIAAADPLADAIPPVAFVTALLIPTPAGGRRVKGDVSGRPDLFYSWNSDETELKIVRKSDSKEVLSATLYPDGTLRQGPKRIGRKHDDEVAIDPFALPPEWPDADKSGDERRMCPKVGPDRRGRPEDKGGKKDRDFEDYMKLWVNPGDPTPRGMGYAFFNPESGNFIIFDDCQKRSGFLFDAKGTTYDWLLTNSSRNVRKGAFDDLFETADRQIAASQGRPIYWVFAEEEAARVAEDGFHEIDPRTKKKPDPKYRQVHFFALPWWEGMQ